MAVLKNKLREFKDEQPADSQKNYKIQCQNLFKLISMYEEEFNVLVPEIKHQRKVNSLQ